MALPDLPRDYFRLAQTFLSPARKYLAEAWPVVFGVPLPTEGAAALAKLPAWEREAGEAASAWESLAASGLIPFSWVGDTARSFHNGMLKEPRISPPSIAAALRIASDWENVCLAEALAREVAQRLLPFSRRGNSHRLCWYFENNPLDMSRQFPPDRARQWGLTALLPALPPPVVRLKSPPGPEAQIDELLVVPPESLRVLASFAHRDALAELRWEYGASRNVLLLPEEKRENVVWRLLHKRPLREFANPFAPLLEIWSLGYALLDLTREEIFLGML